MRKPGDKLPKRKAAPTPAAPTSAPAARAPEPGPSTQPAAVGLGIASWAFGPIAAVRPYLAVRFVLFLLAVDVWSTHLGPAWRYGTAGFNVAHFAFLDRMLGVPTAWAYVGMLALVSACAAAAASLARPPAFLLGLIAALYLWGWSSSMHDSYQHHYLISMMLISMILVPVQSASDLFGAVKGPGEKVGAPWAMGVWIIEALLVPFRLVARPFAALGTLFGDAKPERDTPIPRTHAWQVRLLTAMPAVVYGYTAVSKLEPDWRSGEALRSMTNDGETVARFLGLLHDAGVEGDAVWPLLGGATIAIQILVSLSYWLVPLADADQDSSPASARQRNASLLIGAATAVLVPSVVLTIVLGPSLILGVPVLLSAGLGAVAQRALAGAAPTVPGLVRGICLVGMFAAIAFHVGAEDMGLEIGWFSYYMIGLALVCLAPAGFLSALVSTLTEPLRAFDVAHLPPLAPITVTLLAMMALVGLGDFARAPGALECLSAAGVILLGVGVASMMKPVLGRPAVEAGLGALVVAALSYVSLSRGAERFDYFRFAGGDFRRRGEVAAALEAYQEARELAPADERGRIESRISELEALSSE